jgi:DNA-binding CsgD family transcriptional regulator
MRPYKLSAREHEAALLAAKGLSDRQVAGRMCLAYQSAKNLLNAARRKAGCTSRMQLAVKMRGAA